MKQQQTLISVVLIILLSVTTVTLLYVALRPEPGAIDAADAANDVGDLESLDIADDAFARSARETYERARAAGDGTTMRLAADELRSTGDARYNVEVWNMYVAAADLGDVPAKTGLAWIAYAERKDRKLAVKYAREAAAAGDARACVVLNIAWGDGEISDAEGIEWTRAGADRGDAACMHALGESYLAGKGLAADDAEAVKWFRKAAEAGTQSSLLELATLTAAGRGGLAKDAEAARALLRAAEEAVRSKAGTPAYRPGDLVFVGLTYEKALGDFEEARRLLEERASQGDQIAAVFLRKLIDKRRAE